MKIVPANATIFQGFETWAITNPLEALVLVLISFTVFCYGNALKDAFRG